MRVQLNSMIPTYGYGTRLPLKQGNINSRMGGRKDLDEVMQAGRNSIQLGQLSVSSEQIYLLNEENAVKLSYPSVCGKGTVKSKTVPVCKLGGKSEAKPKHSLEFPHEKLPNSDHEIFFDWLRFFRTDATGLTKRHLDFILHYYLEGYAFKPKGVDNWEPFTWEEKETFAEVQPCSGKRYDYRYVNSIGASLFIRYRGEFSDDIESICFDMSGKAIGAVFPRNNLLMQAEMIDTFESMGMRVTHVDCTDSMPKDTLDISLIQVSALNGDFYGTERYDIRTSGKKNDFKSRGTSVTFGQTGRNGGRRSDKIMQFYQEAPVHGRDRIRAELRNYGRNARLVSKEIRAIFNHPNLDPKQKNFAMVQWVKDYMFSYKTLNFVTAESMRTEKYAKNYKRLSWWEDFLNKLSVATYKPVFEKVTTTLQSLMDWDFRAVIPHYRALAHQFGSDFVHKLIDFAIEAKDKDRLGQFSDSEKSIISELNKLGTMAMSKMFSPELFKKLSNQGFFAERVEVKDYGQTNAIHHRELNLYPQYYQPPLLL